MKLRPAGTSKRVRFELSAEPGSQVFVAGTFNNWNPTANQLTANPLKDKQDSGTYKTALRVPTGTHEYKFVVNGVWHTDPRCQERVLSGYASLNSVLHV